MCILSCFSSVVKNVIEIMNEVETMYIEYWMIFIQFTGSFTFRVLSHMSRL